MRIDPRLARLLLLSGGLFVLAFLFTTTLAHAQQSCGARPAIVATLEKEFGERPVYMAMTKGGRSPNSFSSVATMAGRAPQLC